MKEVNGTTYRDETPDDLVQLLEALRRTGQRVVLIYGDQKTGEKWPPGYTPERGKIGRSAGFNIDGKVGNKVPLLIRTSRSFGGEAILDHCIVEVRESRGGKVIWKWKGK